jgi:DNA-binding response OmpR family regulator
MKPKLLIVEDDSLTLQIYQLVLSKDFDVTECKNENDLNDALLGGDYGLFLVDLSLRGGKNGIDIIRDLRKVDKYRNAKIVVVTAFAGKEDERNALSAGADEFVRKPISNYELIKILKRNASVS